MHIAVMNDDIADRKQLERLLDRESDRRIKTTGNLYIDSFGAVDSLMKTPFLYEMFFINIKGPLQENLKIANDLRALGIRVPICIIKKDFEEEEEGENILYINYPILVNDLTEIVGRGVEINEALQEEKKEALHQAAIEEQQAERNKSFIRKLIEKF